MVVILAKQGTGGPTAGNLRPLGLDTDIAVKGSFSPPQTGKKKWGLGVTSQSKSVYPRCLCPLMP